MLEQSYDFFLFRLAVDPPDPDGTERDGSHRASGFFPDERHGSAPTAALVADQTTDHVQAGDPYFQGEVLSDPTVSSRTASRQSRCQNTSIYYRCTVSPTICVHRIRLSGVLLLCTSSLELSRDICKIGWRFGLVVTRSPRSTLLRYVRPG